MPLVFALFSDHCRDKHPVVRYEIVAYFPHSSHVAICIQRCLHVGADDLAIVAVSVLDLYHEQVPCFAKVRE